MRTTGFKKQRAEFQDLFYQNLRRVGTTTSDQGTRLPAGLDIGGGVKVVSTPRVMSQGNLTSTEKDLDVAIRGEGFFRVTLPDGRIAYTRAGSFERDDQGRIVTPEGYLLEPQMTIPPTATGVTINQQGQVSVITQGNTTPTVLGQFVMSRFVNKAGLQAVGDNLFIETPASGTPQDGVANTDGFGDLQQSNLEQSNVEAVTEISDLIAAQRAYEMNAKVITATDQMLQSISGLMR
jgi:flagellar basal-body rod protein FlgG